MKYLSKKDVLKFISEKDLDVLIQQEDAALDGYELTAIDQITPYLHAYDLAKLFSPPINQHLVMIACDIMIYHMHATISADHIPELREQRYHLAIDWLKEAHKERLSLDLSKKNDASTVEAPTGGGVRYGSLEEGNNNFY